MSGKWSPKSLASCIKSRAKQTTGEIKEELERLRDQASVSFLTSLCLPGGSPRMLIFTFYHDQKVKPVIISSSGDLSSRLSKSTSDKFRAGPNFAVLFSTDYCCIGEERTTYGYKFIYQKVGYSY